MTFRYEDSDMVEPVEFETLENAMLVFERRVMEAGKSKTGGGGRLYNGVKLVAWFEVRKVSR